MPPWGRWALWAFAIFVGLGIVGAAIAENTGPDTAADATTATTQATTTTAAPEPTTTTVKATTTSDTRFVEFAEETDCDQLAKRWWDFYGHHERLRELDDAEPYASRLDARQEDIDYMSAIQERMAVAGCG